MMGVNTYGVCTYDFDAYEPKLEELVKFNTYDEAFDYYMKKLPKKRTGYLFPKDFWLVILDENDNIVQFEQLDWKVKSKIVEPG